MEKQSNKEELQLMIIPERPTKSAQMLNIYGENPNEKKSETKTSLELSWCRMKACSIFVNWRGERSKGSPLCWAVIIVIVFLPKSICHINCKRVKSHEKIDSNRASIESYTREHINIINKWKYKFAMVKSMLFLYLFVLAFLLCYPILEMSVKRGYLLCRIDKVKTSFYLRHIYKRNQHRIQFLWGIF